MFALVALVPFVLLATVMGLSWWEDRILPPAGPTGAPAPCSGNLNDTAPGTPPHASPGLLTGTCLPPVQG